MMTAIEEVKPAEVCRAAATRIAAKYAEKHGSEQPASGILVSAGAGELAAALLEVFPETVFWFIEERQDVANALTRATEFAHSRRRVVTLAEDQGEKRCPYRQIDLVVVNGLSIDGSVAIESRVDAEHIVGERAAMWRHRLEASKDRAGQAANRVFVATQDSS